jgi:hypothetical protein
MNIDKIYQHKMMKFRILTLLFTLTSALAFAQEEWEKNDGEIEDVEIEIVKNREIVLPKANRNFEKIPPTSHEKNSNQIEYFFSNLNLPLPALNIRIRPLRIKGEELNKLYGNYIKAGFGNYTTPYLEGYFSSKRNQTLLYGAHVNYINSKNGPVDTDNSGSGAFNVEVFGKYFGKTTTASGEIGLNRDSYHFYGYNDALNVGTDSLKQNFNNVFVQGYLENTNKTNKLQYLTGFRFDYLKDNYEALESELQLDFKAEYALGDQSKIDLVMDYDLISQKDEFLEVKSRNIFRVKPTVTFEYEGFLINAGFNAVYENDTLSDSDELHFYPMAQVQFSVPSGFRIYAGIRGDVEKLTLRKLTDENPFISANTRAFNSYKTFEFYGGIDGSLSSKLGFGAGASIANYQNMYFFINDPSDQSKFVVFYDTGNTALVNVFGELSYNRNDELRFVMRGDYWGYNTDLSPEAWHRPNYKVSAISTYKLFDKFRFEAEAFTLGGIQAFDPNNNETVKLDAAFDLNFTTEYLFSKQFSAFVRLNNIFSKEYELLYNYPTRGFQFMIGATYSF